MKTAILAFLATILTAPATAADCSDGPIKDTPLGGTVAGKPFVAKEIRLDFTKDGMVMNDVHLDRYVLSLMVDGVFNEATIDMLVPGGKKPDGRTFRVLPVDSIGAQPAAAEGVPEVQGWEIELDNAGIDTSFTEDVASIRIEWGMRKDKTLPGKIHFCVPSVKADIEGSFSVAVP
ncbi:MAG: hypothetical protein JSR60_14600 [Proteobacteria bacterium]|nr:hypothetical protein [Pseudomonadota bacterium]